VVVPFEPADSSSAWTAALATMQDYSPWLESPHTGLAYLAQLDAQQAESLALELQARLGLAASRGTALIAATAAKANTVNVVTNEAAFLEAAPSYLLRVAGLRVATLEKLRLFGLDTLGKIARLSLRQLEAQFGPEASRLVALCSGADVRPVPVFQSPPQVTARLGLDSGLLEPGELEPVMAEVLERVWHRLEGRHCSSLKLELETVLGASRYSVMLKVPSQDPKVLWRAAQTALRHCLSGLEVTALSITLEGLHKPTPVQDSLFGILERPLVREAIRTVHGKFPNRIGRLVISRPKAHLSDRRFQFTPLTGEETPKRTRNRKST
jgi:DNA polymerase IV